MNPLRRLKKATGTQAGAIDPRTWNDLGDLLAELDRRILSLCPQSSPDIKVRNLGSTSGPTFYLAKRPRNTASSCPLRPVLSKSGADWSIYVTAGLSGNLLPDFDATPVGPTNLQPITVSTSLYLAVTWEPASDYDADLELYWIIGGGTHISSEFILSATPPTNTEAAIDPDTGSPTNGVYHFLWAIIDITAGLATITASRCGNHQFTFCPGTLSLIFDAVGLPAEPPI